jgi:hypothetical protein
MLFAATFATGCGASKRPYAHDPLLRHGRGVWGDPVRGRSVDRGPVPEPEAPRAPAPVELPTLEWETPRPE